MGAKIQILIDRDLHRRVKAAAAIRGESITDFADVALSGRLHELGLEQLVRPETKEQEPCDES